MDDDETDAEPASPEAPDKPEAGARRAYGSGDFHSLAQKQILNAAFAVLSEAKMDWALIAPFLEAARDLCVADFEETGQVRIHTTREQDGTWIEAEEAFLGIAVMDRDHGKPWLIETWWISDIATADDDPAEARRIVRALERSIERINAWLADKPPAP